MSFFKIHHVSNYTCISNKLLKDVRLSNKSIGLMAKILSLPEDWDFSYEGLASICKDGIGSIGSSIKELKKYGYIKITPFYQNGRIIDWMYDVYENPEDINDSN